MSDRPPRRRLEAPPFRFVVVFAWLTVVTWMADGLPAGYRVVATVDWYSCLA